jgi:hypothetical protein
MHDPVLLVQQSLKGLKGQSHEIFYFRLFSRIIFPQKNNMRVISRVKIMKTFLIEDFSCVPPVSMTPVVDLGLRISLRIFDKIGNGPNGLGGN